MPTKVEIDGVGIVELDDSFDTMDPADQERTISQIASQFQTPKAPQAAPSGQASAPRPKPMPTGNARAAITSLFPQVEITDWKRDPNSPLGLANPGSYHNSTEGALDVRPIPGMTFEQYVSKIKDAGYPIIEARDEVKNPTKHATGPHWHVVVGQKPGGDGMQPGDPVPGMTADPATGIDPTTAAPGMPPAEKFDNAQSFALGAADSAAFGFADEVGAGLDMILGGPEGTETIWNSDKSIADLYRKNRDFNRDALGQSRDEDPVSSLMGGIAGGLIPISRLGKTVKGASDLSRAERFGKAVFEGGTMGGLYGAGSGEGDFQSHLDSIGEFGSYGVAGGAVLDGVLGTALDRIKTKPDRWAKRELERNEFSAFDAEIVADIKGATTNRAVSKGDPEGRAAVTAKTINNIEQGYFAEFKNGINQLEIPDVEKLALKAAITRKYALPIEEANALRGTPAGDAVADAVIKVQRLRQLTPEMKGKSGLLGKTAAVSDLLPIPGVIGRGLRMAARAAGDGEAARVNAAEKLLAREEAYKKLGLIAGPSGQKESQANFWNAVSQTADAKAAQKAVPKARRNSPAEAAIDRMVEKGVQGDSRSLQHYMDALGTSREDTIKLLDAITPDNPGLEGDIARLKLSHTTSNNRLGPVLRPQLRAAMDKMGIKPGTIPVDEAVQTRLAGADQPPVPLKVTRDNPGGEWLERKRSAAEREQAEATEPGIASRGLRGSTTAQARTSIPVRLLKNLEGVAGEKPAAGQVKYDALAESIAKDGFNQKSPIMVWVNHKGEAFVYEGNNRVAHAAKNGIENLDVEVQWRNGAEDVDGPFSEKSLRGQGDEALPLKTKPTQREMELTARLDEIDPVQGTFEDGTAQRQSEAGMQDEATMAEIQKLNKELEEVRQLRRVDRPQQWEQGRNRYQTQATDSIKRMQQDERLSPQVFETLGNAPQQIRDNFKTAEEAETFIVERILPDLEADGHTPDEIKRVRTYLMEVAQAKPYATQAQFEAGTRQRPAGRQPQAN